MQFQQKLSHLFFQFPLPGHAPPQGRKNFQIFRSTLKIYTLACSKLLMTCYININIQNSIHTPNNGAQQINNPYALQQTCKIVDSSLSQLYPHFYFPYFLIPFGLIQMRFTEDNRFYLRFICFFQSVSISCFLVFPDFKFLSIFSILPIVCQVGHFSRLWNLYSHHLHNNQMKKLLNISLVLAGVGSLGYTYISYKASSNYSDYITELKEREKLGIEANNIYLIPTKDEIELITNQLDTGDNLFMKFHYRSALTKQNYLKGLIKAYFGVPSQPDSCGYIYKNDKSTYVLFNDTTQTQVQKFEDFVNLPYLAILWAQKNNKKVELQSKLAGIVQKQPGVVKVQKTKQTEIDMVNRINKILYQKQYRFTLDLRLLITNPSNLIPIKTRVDRFMQASMSQ